MPTYEVCDKCGEEFVIEDDEILFIESNKWTVFLSVLSGGGNLRIVAIFSAFRKLFARKAEIDKNEKS